MDDTPSSDIASRVYPIIIFTSLSIGCISFTTQASTASASAQQVTGQGHTRRVVGDAKSVEDVLESVRDVAIDYHGQAKHDSTKDEGKLLKERYVDVGALSNEKKRKCDKGFVNCVNGFVKGSRNTITCKDACGGSCCVGNSKFPDACEKFTGQICKDQSCSGEKACTYASIKSVIYSCQGSYACSEAAISCANPNGCGAYNAVTGRIGPVVNSCNGYRACDRAGYADGHIGSIQDSCNGYAACLGAGRLGGMVLSIQNSCNDEFACTTVGSRGAVGSIKNSCGGFFACVGAGELGSVGSIRDSCLGNKACYFAGAFGVGIGGVGSIEESCIGLKSCSGLGADVGGGAGSLFQSCNGDSACRFAGARDGLSWELDSPEPDAVGTGLIDSNLIGCCNEPELCEGANEATLPLDCM